ncbi:MAG: cytochrome P460 family protein [Gemmatimonadaceae bacterium]
MTRTAGVVACLLLSSTACAHSRDETTEPPPGGQPQLVVSDDVLRQLVAGRANWAFYRNNASPLARSAGSGHIEPQLRTQYNPRAATQLDANGRVRSGAVFPDSAVIVKELLSGSTLTTIAVMMKLRGSPQASQGGWVWGYFTPGGAVRVSVDARGSGCAGCHSSGIDYTRMNDSHP